MADSNASSPLSSPRSTISDPSEVNDSVDAVIPIEEQLQKSQQNENQDTKPEVHAWRPKRERKAPTRLDPLDTHEPESSSQISKRTPGSAKEPNYSTTFLLTNKKSILTELDLDTLLSDDEAWTCLSREQQLYLLAMLPGAPALSSFDPDKPLPNLPKQMLKESASFRADLRVFQEDLGEGKHDPEWNRQAKEAAQERSAGVFDEWEDEERKEAWGQKTKGTDS